MVLDFSMNLLWLSWVKSRDKSMKETGPDSPKLYIWVVQPNGQLDFRTVELTADTADLASLVTNSREASSRSGRVRAGPQ